MAGGSVTDWLTAIGTVGTGIVAAVLAVFGHSVRAIFFKPRLEASVGSEARYSHHLTRLEDGVNKEAYWCRLAVENRGNVSARDVEVRLESLTLKDSGGSFEPDPYFRPLNLRWSHSLNWVMPKIDQGLAKYCDLCHVWRNPGELLLELDTQFTPAQVRSGVWPTKKPAGCYRVGIALTAANCKPKLLTFEINFSGAWIADSEAMFRDGLVLAGPWQTEKPKNGRRVRVANPSYRHAPEPQKAVKGSN